MIRCADVPDPANVSRQTLPSPALAAQNEAQMRSKLGRTDKVVFHSPFAIGKTIGDQYEIALKRRIFIHGMVSRGIESVVDGHTVLRA